MINKGSSVPEVTIKKIIEPARTPPQSQTKPLILRILFSFLGSNSTKKNILSKQKDTTNLTTHQYVLNFNTSFYSID